MSGQQKTCQDLRWDEKNGKTTNSPDIHMAIHDLQGFKEQALRQ